MTAEPKAAAATRGGASPDFAHSVKKRLVLCFDGTWNNADNIGADTNVTLLARSIHATTDTAGVLQSVLYLRGVGTTGLDITQSFDGATGLGIDDNIRSGYMFLCQNYLPGDEIFIFGFSRGAFTARSLVGLISSTGLLYRESLGELGQAWLYYRKGVRPLSPQAFLAVDPAARTHTDVEIQCLGVWETVGSLGIPGHVFDLINHDLYGFYDTTLCPIVRNAYHALAIDEHRDSFVPTLWTGEVPGNCHVEQVWFAGAHSDVGGGYKTRNLADIPLLWMANKAQQAGLALDWTWLATGRSSDPLAPRHDSSSGVFLYNRVIPTIREICGQTFHVPLFQRLYTPTDAHYQPLSVLNEAVHESVVKRFGQQSLLCRDDKGGTNTEETYAPKNVGALFDPLGQLKDGVLKAPIT